MGCRWGLPAVAFLVQESQKIIETKTSENEFEVILRILGNELIAIRLSSSNFKGKMIFWGILLLFFTFMMIEIFNVQSWSKIMSG